MPTPNLAALLITSIILLTPCSADAFRCNGKIIEPGDNQYKVAKLCGDPQSVYTNTQHQIYRHYKRVLMDSKSIKKDSKYSKHQPSKFEKQLIRERHKNIDLEEWHYDFGPNNFSRLFIFRNRILVHIVTGGYGINSNIQHNSKYRRLVRTGDWQSTVRLKLGKPDHIEIEIHELSEIRYLDTEKLNSVETISYESFERWAYNRGKSKLERILTFSNNRLMSASH